MSQNKMERVRRFKAHPVTKELQRQSRLVWFLLVALQLFLLVGAYAFKLETFILLLISLMISLGFYLFFKDELEAKEKRYGTVCLKIVVTIVVINLTNSSILSGMSDFVQQGKISSGFLEVLMAVIDVIILAAMITLLNKPKTKKQFERMEDTSIFANLVGEIIQPGDAMIGIDQETLKPVRLPEEDRYLHMLLLGPTGSGKTALSLTPMVWRDLNALNPDGSVSVGISVIEPKGDFAEKVWAMAKIANREVIYFNPILKSCPYFNPLEGPMTDVIENMATTFKMFSSDSSQFFQDANDGLLRRAVKVLKRIEEHYPQQNATLISLSSLIHNTGGQGRQMVNTFQKLPVRNSDEQKEQEEIALWFLNDYFTGCSGDRGATKTYENTSAIRTQISKLNSNLYLRKVLNPPPGVKSELNFDYALEHGQVLAISTAQGTLQDLGKFLGYFIILQFQSSVFRRPGNEDTRLGNMLYIDEFQVYANMGFANMLTQGRSYRVASHLATQNRALIGANAGKDAKAFIDLVSTNARNQVIYGGGNYEDAKFYSNQFGEQLETRVDRGISRPVNSIWYGMKGLGSRPSESLREVEESVACFTPSDIIYKDFGYVTYSLMKNKSLQRAGVSKLEFIPYDLKKQIDQMVSEYNAKEVIKNADDLLMSTTEEAVEYDAGGVTESEYTQTTGFQVIDFDLPDYSKKDIYKSSSEVLLDLESDDYSDEIGDFESVSNRSESVVNSDDDVEDNLF